MTDHAAGVSSAWCKDQISCIAFLGAALSNLCHLRSVLFVYELSATVFHESSGNSSVHVAIAALHIINPAGAFLLSPYSEALFSSLNILGFKLYLGGLRNYHDGSNFHAEIQCLAAGAVFGIATTVRSNGLLSGTLFLYDAAFTVISLLVDNLSVKRCRRLMVICIGGCFIALGAVIPQYGVYVRYCTFDTGYGTRPWCNNYVPSIYAWVQGHYWYESHTSSHKHMLIHRIQECWSLSLLDPIKRTIVPPCCASNVRAVQVLSLGVERRSECIES